MATEQLEDVDATQPLQPEEAVALAIAHDLITNYPEELKALLIQHNVQPSTDPEENILKIAQLSAKMGRWFNEDWSRVTSSFGYHGAELMADVLGKYAAKQKNIKHFQAGYFSVKDVFNKIKDKVKSIFHKSDGGTQAPGDVAATDAAKTTADAANAANPNTPTPKKKILGMVPWLFYSVLGFVLILIVVITILVIRAGKKKKSE